MATINWNVKQDQSLREIQSKNQRSNFIMPDITCNCTSVAFCLENLGYKSWDFADSKAEINKYVDLTDDTLKAAFTTNCQLEDRLTLHILSLAGEKTKEKDKDCYNKSMGGIGPSSNFKFWNANGNLTKITRANSGLTLRGGGQWAPNQWVSWLTFYANDFIKKNYVVKQGQTSGRPTHDCVKAFYGRNPELLKKYLDAGCYCVLNVRRNGGGHYTPILKLITQKNAIHAVFSDIFGGCEKISSANYASEPPYDRGKNYKNNNRDLGKSNEASNGEKMLITDFGYMQNGKMYFKNDTCKDAWIVFLKPKYINTSLGANWAKSTYKEGPLR